MSKLPTTEQVRFIRQNLGVMDFQTMRKAMKITTGELLEWYKITYNPKKAAHRWKHITQNLDFIEMNEDPQEIELVNDYLIGGHERTNAKKKRIYSPMRMFYLVTIDYDYCYIAKFSEPVPYEAIKYYSKSTGCDYTIEPLGHWEYIELRDFLTIVSIDAQLDYVGLFWYTFKLINETRREQDSAEVC